MKKNQTENWKNKQKESNKLKRNQKCEIKFWKKLRKIKISKSETDQDLIKPKMPDEDEKEIW